MKRAVVFLLLAVPILAYLLRAQRTTVIESPLDLDFENAGRGGGRAFYLECRQLWPDSRRMGWQRHWQERSRIVVSVRYLSNSRLEKMLEWVREGHEASFMIYAHESFLRDLHLGYLYNSTAQPAEPGMVRRRNGPLLKEADGSLHLCARKPLGKGFVTVLADPWCVSNDGLDRGRNAELAHQLVGAPATFLCPSDEMDWETLLLLSPWTRLAVLASLGLVLLYARNHYLPWSRRRALPTPPQRSMLEFVDAAAWLFQRAGAYRQASESLERGAAVRLGRRLEDQERLGKVHESNVVSLARKFQKYITEAGR